MERITLKDLQRKVDCINSMTHRPDTPTRIVDEPVGFFSILPNVGHLYIDHYSPGGNPYTYKLCEVTDHSGEHCLTSYRMTVREFNRYLDGFIEGLESKVHNG